MYQSKLKINEKGQFTVFVGDKELPGQIDINIDQDKDLALQGMAYANVRIVCKVEGSTPLVALDGGDEGWKPIPSTEDDFLTGKK